MTTIAESIQLLPGFFGHTALNQPPSSSPVVARPIFYLIGHLSAALLLLEHSVWSSTTGSDEWETDAEVVNRWVERRGELAKTREEVERVLGEDQSAREAERWIVYGSSAKL